MQQPKALRVFFMTEMWERFGFYTVQALLVLYMIEHFHFSDTDAYQLLGQFVVLVYALPVLGGWVSDRYLGNRLAVLLGGFLLCIGYALLASEKHALFLGLSLVILGNSLFKPNISSFLGQFYTTQDPRRDAGFTLFYVGINVGSLLGPLSAGCLREWISWSASFAAASFALLLGVCVFRRGYRYFDEKGWPPHLMVKTLGGFLKAKPVAVLLFLAILSMVYFSITHLVAGSYALYAAGLLFCGYILWIARKQAPDTRWHMPMLLVMLLISTLFWSLFFQMFSAVNVFTERAVDRVIGGYEVPTTVFLSIEACLIITMGPLLSYLWKSNSIRLSGPMKFALGVLFLALSMQTLAWITLQGDVAITWIWLMVVYFFMAVGELLLSPIGLSMVTEYTPQQYTSLMMGGWMMSMGFGGKLTGLLAAQASIPEGMTDLGQMIGIYHDAFQYYAWIGFVGFAVCLCLVPLIRKKLRHAA